MTGVGHGKQPRWSVGVPAEVTGLTVRTLHHYDELGLLRQLGMSLEEVGEVLADPSHGPLREVLTGHLDRLDDQAARLEALRRQTRGLLDQLDGPARQDPGGLLALLGCTGIFDDCLTGEQREFLDGQAERLTEAGRGQLRAEWPEVLAAIVGHYRADTRRTTRRSASWAAGRPASAGTSRAGTRRSWRRWRRSSGRTGTACCVTCCPTSRCPTWATACGTT
ncbi:MerR family DNA-binding protein [Actinosynnema sp. NPDC050436]|uniref:MerR family DNA-binding protein n=1 Tax=Actinosynnema sp. NPDC050436 TaxID=3155659 RepID=UPI0033FDFD56